eukprot:5518725-Pyramimonas_sp.AAC.1
MLRLILRVNERLQSRLMYARMWHISRVHIPSGTYLDTLDASLAKERSLGQALGAEAERRKKEADRAKQANATLSDANRKLADAKAQLEGVQRQLEGDVAEQTDANRQLVEKVEGEVKRREAIAAEVAALRVRIGVTNKVGQYEYVV